MQGSQKNLHGNTKLELWPLLLGLIAEEKEATSVGKIKLSQSSSDLSQKKIVWVRVPGNFFGKYQVEIWGRHMETK